MVLFQPYKSLLLVLAVLVVMFVIHINNLSAKLLNKPYNAPHYRDAGLTDKEFK
jgi:hypothetical protein